MITKFDSIIFDFSDTLVKMRPARLLICRSLLVKLGIWYKLGIITGGRKVEVFNIIRKLNLGKLFFEPNIITKSDTPWAKPNYRLLKEMERRINSKLLLYIGDSKNDSIMAKNANIPFLSPDEFVKLKW